MKKLFGCLLIVGAMTYISAPVYAESLSSEDIVIAQAEEKKGLFRNNSFFSGKKKEEAKVDEKNDVEVKSTPTSSAVRPADAKSSDVSSARRERPDLANMSDEERQAWREKRRAEIEEMRKNMPPPKELTAAEKAERKAKREKRRAEIEKMRANMPPPKELTAAEKAERKARMEKRRAEIEKMRN